MSVLRTGKQRERDFLVKRISQLKRELKKILLEMQISASAEK